MRCLLSILHCNQEASEIGISSLLMQNKSTHSRIYPGTPLAEASRKELKAPTGKRRIIYDTQEFQRLFEAGDAAKLMLPLTALRLHCCQSFVMTPSPDQTDLQLS